MRAIRKGNDINILWDIMHEVEGQSQPYDLTGKDLTLYLGTPYGREKVPGITTQGNTVVWTYWGKEQKCIGIHSLTLVINEGSEFMQTVDACQAFQIVERSCMAGGEDEEGIRTETINLNSRIDIAAIMPDTELNRNSMNVVTNQAIVEGIENAVQSYEERFGELSESVNDKLGEVDGILNSKADKDGHYPEFTSGFADNLVGRGESIPAEFSFRASGGKSIEDGTARIKTLKGNAVVWNQILPDDMEGQDATVTKTEQGYIINPTGSYPGIRRYYIYPILGHKYAILCTKAGGTAELKMNWGGYDDAINTGIISASNEEKNAIILYSLESETFTLTHPMLIDLTKMFGAGNEPTTIEEFNARKPIVEDENAYNEGEVIPFTAEGIKSIGDNAWDEEWRNGYYENGEFIAYDAFVANKNKMRVLTNSEYYYRGVEGVTIHVCAYDRDMNYITDITVLSNTTFLTPDNAVWINFRFGSNYGNTYNNDICISLVHSGYKEGKYFPYEQDIRKIDSRILEEFPNGMMPWDKVYNKNGKGYIVKGTGVVEDMSLLNWDTGFGGFHTSNIRHNIKHLYEYIPSNILCSRLATNLVSSDDVGIALIYGGSADYPYNGNIKIVGYDSLNSLLADLQGIPLYYELAEPTIIEYDEPFNLDYLVWDFGTEEIIADKPSAPLKADIIYQFNAVDEIRELRQLIATMQAQLASLTSNNGGQ